jgi:phosphoenolpyruvate synthase/pyruvate phosphate dikinase
MQAQNGADDGRLPHSVAAVQRPGEQPGGVPVGEPKGARMDRSSDGMYVVDLDRVDRAWVAQVGAKAANLGELSTVDGVRVPAGSCVTTAAYRRLVSGVAELDDALERLSAVAPDDRAPVATLSRAVRSIIETIPVPAEVASAIVSAVERHGEGAAFAVRSSATAEDLAGASFAGQQDTFLNVVGTDSVLAHVRRCWASAFTERAVTYRQRHRVDHRGVQMAVVVQRMVAADVAGVMFTADPVTSNRRVAVVEATFGLGEALVSGLVQADTYSVRDDEILERTVRDKRIAVQADAGGGTRRVEVDPARRGRPALDDARVLELVRLGRRIESHFASPQDVEWCLVGDELHVVQSRPITTLWPVPDREDDAPRVYVSVGHQQMMTDPMAPLGVSFWELTTPAPVREAAGRMFVDVTAALASPATRAGILALGASDPLIGDALATIVERGDIVERSPAPPPDPTSSTSRAAASPGPPPIEADPATVTELMSRNDAAVAGVERDLAGRTGTDLIDAIMADLPELRRQLFDPESHRVLTAGFEARDWLSDRMADWLGASDVADTLAQSVPHNVTSEMGIALLDVADVIRPHPEVVAHLAGIEGGDEVLAPMDGLRGGPECRAAFESFLDTYGARCVGEIDITRPRWRERPSDVVPIVVANIRNFAPGEGARRVERGRRAATELAADLLDRLRALPDGDRRAEQTEQMIGRLRTFTGYREYPKFGMVRRYFVYKQALMAEADRMVAAGVLHDREDLFFLSLPELRDVVESGKVDHILVRERREALRSYRSMTPPRVFTSDGEAVAGSYRRNDVPPDTLVGLAVSTGTVEGRARVVLDVAEADLEPGDILVTAFTDPSWTPLFVAIGGLVTEVGGLMTHGAVIAREYGLPAVVGVEHATQRIRDGQRIRVDGADGTVHLLDGP